MSATVECIRCWERFSAAEVRSQGWLCPKCNRFTQARASNEDRAGGEGSLCAPNLAGPVTSELSTRVSNPTIHGRNDV
jgi:hypothetical protein